MHFCQSQWSKCMSFLSKAFITGIEEIRGQMTANPMKNMWQIYEENIVTSISFFVYSTKRSFNLICGFFSFIFHPFRSLLAIETETTRYSLSTQIKYLKLDLFSNIWPKICTFFFLHTLHYILCALFNNMSVSLKQIRKIIQVRDNEEKNVHMKIGIYTTLIYMIWTLWCSV